ncbi:hypothetical protein P1N98_08555, partial [Tsukamurella tyrosinosolvens]|uniref:hypothetical protein n=1 Tax=Tsukamurella tyrosinosolvens TaxID=57704 RepID=UPI0024814597
LNLMLGLINLLPVPRASSAPCVELLRVEFDAGDRCDAGGRYDDEGGPLRVESMHGIHSGDPAMWPAVGAHDR